MSPRVGSEAESGNTAIARDTDREETRPKLTVWPGTAPQAKTPTPVERIGKLTAAELAELSPPDARGVQSGAFSKRFGQPTLDWSALRNPTPLPPPPAAEAVTVPMPSAVHAFYGKLPETSERAELHIADLSLELANPFVGSSLMPPPPKKRPWLRPMLITLGGCLLIGAGYVGAVYHVERHAASAVAKWTGAEVAPAIVVPELPPQAATIPSAPHAQSPELEPVLAEHPIAAPTGEAAHIAPTVEEAVALEEAVATAEPQQTVDSAPIEAATAAVIAAPVTESTAAATSPRSRRHAARAARAVAAQASAKPVEPKPEVALSAAPAAPAAPPRAVLAPNPYITRTAAPAPTAVRAPAVAPGPMPQTLSRAQVQTGLESVRGQLQTCAAGAHGRMTSNVTISGAGRVTYATVDGAFAGTPQGSCMARALRGAQFPQFASPQLRVVYPFAL